MFTSEHQISLMVEEKPYCDDIRSVQRTGGGPSKKASSSLESARAMIKLNHERHTDVMYVDVCFPEDGACVDVIEVGEELGFPGMVQARVDLKQQIVYGLTIQNFTSFQRKMRWHFRIWSIAQMLELVVRTLRAGLGLDHSRNNKPALGF
jgi:hypothetical protein